MSLLDEQMVSSLTADWLKCFQQDKKSGRDLASMPFWRLAVEVGLPVGVDPDDLAVRAALAEIRECLGQKKD